MTNVVQNIIVLSVCWLLVTGAGVYVTYFDQPEELERLHKVEKVARLKQAEVTSLLAEETNTKQRAEEIVRRWRARYKVIPSKLDDEEIVAYFNRLSKVGFKNFDITFEKQGHHKDFSTFSYQIVGRGYFKSLYEAIWKLENNRNFYRVRDLKLNHIDLVTPDQNDGRPELQVMVSFSMGVDAYFGGAKGLSASSVVEQLYEEGYLPSSPTSNLPPVPASVLPDPDPAVNPFFPIIMDMIPPNSDNLVNIEEAKLISIVGGQAIFQWKGDFYPLDVGGRVYLGQIVQIDPMKDQVVARLNKGGIIDEVEMHLQTGDRYRQAIGPGELAPTIK